MKLLSFSLAPLRAVLGCLALFGAVCAHSASLSSPGVLSLDQAVALAWEQDPWLQSNRHQQHAMEAMSVAAGALPDPKVTLAMSNLPTNTWDFDQEPMTQMVVGVSQMFPRGDQRALKREQMQRRSQQMPFERAERRARIRRQVSELWLDAWQAQQSIALIERNRYLFEQMSDITQSSYASALGRTRQHDVIRAQVEITRLEDRLIALQQRRDTTLAALRQWLISADQHDGERSFGRGVAPLWSLPTALPVQMGSVPSEWLQGSATDDWVTQRLLLHPSVAMLEQKMRVSQTDVSLAQQKYKPEWGVSASYGYREDDPMGNERADFFSVGVTLDLPMFTGGRQDQEVSAAVSQVEAIKSEKWVRLRALLSEYVQGVAQWRRLVARDALFQSTLLPQMHEQAEAALTAYTNDSGEFAEVMRARIAELNAEIDALAITAQRGKVAIQLRYVMASAEPGSEGDHQEDKP